MEILHQYICVLGRCSQNYSKFDSRIWYWVRIMLNFIHILDTHTLLINQRGLKFKYLAA
jgi:hypothetical protein